jgi:excisionase family DNA binding protein
MKKEVYYTPGDVAAYLDVPVNTVYVWIWSGRLSAYKFGGRYKIAVNDFEAFKAKSRVTVEVVLPVIMDRKGVADVDN